MLIEKLSRVVRGETFDEQPMPDLDSEALDFRAASESFARVRKLSIPAIVIAGSGDRDHRFR